MVGQDARDRSEREEARRCWQFWRSPSGQPRFARPLLLLIAAVAAVAYGWGMASASVEPFYGAAARSMSQSWHNFFFGSFDPAGTVTVDKLPGALWVQALSIRVLGFHLWALVLPQVVEGVLTVLVLYRAVRRLAGVPAGLVAAAVLASTPITVLLGRGNVSDSLLVLLLVLAADATSAALCGGKLRWLLLAGLWVGLAFQAKMLQAWLVLPALVGAYLLAAPISRWRTRLGHIAAAGLVMMVVSLSWMTVVSMVPTHDRPYVDGSRHDSLYEQVFDYNGLARAGRSQLKSATGPIAPFLAASAEGGNTLNSGTARIGASWHRLLSGPLGRDGGWLLPTAAFGAIAGLRRRRTSERDGPDSIDHLRAAVILWGGWWLVLAVFFSAGAYVNSYYLAALAPAVAALCGVGVAVCGPPPWSTRVRLAVLGVVASSVAYGMYLLRGAAVVPYWVIPVALVTFVIATGLLLLPSSGVARWSVRVCPTGAVAALASTLVLPLSASATVVARGLGPFDTPFESQQISTATQVLGKRWPGFESVAMQFSAHESGLRIMLGVDTSARAASLILATGREVLPIGGYLGGDPVPTLSSLQSDVNNGYVNLFELPVKPRSPDPRVQWIEATCTQQELSDPTGPVQFAFYHCGA